MDELDREILGILQENARVSFSSLGQQIGLSTNAAAARVRRMESTGIITGYTVRTGVDIPDSPHGLEVFIDVRLSTEIDSEVFLAQVASITQIVDVVHVTGAYDYLLHAFVIDTSALDSLLRRLKKDGGATHTQTRVALRSRIGQQR